MSKPNNFYRYQLDSEAFQRHTHNVSPLAVQRAREGVNEHCVDCDAVPMGGGLRCSGCYLKVARPKRQTACANPEPTIRYWEGAA